MAPLISGNARQQTMLRMLDLFCKDCILMSRECSPYERICSNIGQHMASLSQYIDRASHVRYTIHHGESKEWHSHTHSVAARSKSRRLKCSRHTTRSVSQGTPSLTHAFVLFRDVFNPNPWPFFKTDTSVTFRILTDSRSLAFRLVHFLWWLDSWKFFTTAEEFTTHTDP